MKRSQSLSQRLILMEQNTWLRSVLKGVSMRPLETAEGGVDGGEGGEDETVA